VPVAATAINFSPGEALDHLIGARLVVLDQLVRKRRRPHADLRRDRRAVEEDDAIAHSVISVLDPVALTVFGTARSGLRRQRLQAESRAGGVPPRRWPRP
jgi:hypothetical protein